MLHKQPESLLDTLLHYEEHIRTTMLEKRANATLAQVRTALLRYTLPGWGFSSPQGRRLSQEDYELGLNFLRQVTLKQLGEAPALQEQLFEQWSVPGNSRRNYRWALNRFIDWCKGQPWFESEVGSTLERPVARKQAVRGSANDLRLTSRPSKGAYRLAESKIPASLQQELDAYSRYLTEEKAKEQAQSQRAVSPGTARQYLNQVLRFLGWLHTDQKVSLQELGLHRLVEFIAAEEGETQKNLRQAGAQRTVELIQAYFLWLRALRTDHLDGQNLSVESPHTESHIINTWIVVTRFVYRQEIASQGSGAEQTIPVIAALRELKKGKAARLKAHQPVSDESKKHLKWSEFLELVESLRRECVLRLPQSTQSKQGGTTLGSMRSLAAIGQSYQRFLLTALLAYFPPQRPQVLRSLEIGQLSGQEKPRPDSDAVGESWMLYQEREDWCLKIGDQKKERSQPDSLMLIPNLSYGDGRCFYQYLEEWLLLYRYQDEGTTVEVPGLRSCFNPSHSRLFTTKSGYPYREASAFISLLRNPAHRITGKALDFFSLRKMYVEHMNQKEGSGVESENPVEGTDCEVVSDLDASLDLDENYEYDPSDWQQAATIAQAFLNQAA